MAKQKPKAPLSFGTLIIVGLIVIFVTVCYFSLPWRTAQRMHRIQPPIACTMEARLCPDGSAVGRSGSWCEFAACPVVQNPETTGGIIYRNERYGFSLTLPESWQGYRASVAADDGKTTICFYFAGSRPFCAMQLLAYTPEQWSKVSVIGSQALVSRAIADDGSVVALDYSPGCVQMDAMQCARSREVPGIFRTLSFSPSA